MMVNSVSGVRFCANEDMFSRPGAYSRPVEAMPAQADAQPKKSKTGKVILGLVAAAAVILGGAAALKHYDLAKLLPEADLANAGILKKAEHYVAKFGEGVIEKSNLAIDWAKGLFKSNPV